MTDTIIKGTGNSRSIIIPPDAKSRYHSVDDILDAMIAGTFMVDIGPLNPAGCDVVGTANNKANLLSNEVEMQIWGSVQDRTVNQVLLTRREEGSYVGDGDREQSTPGYVSPDPHSKTLIFSFRPKLVFLYRIAKYSTSYSVWYLISPVGGLGFSYLGNISSGSGNQIYLGRSDYANPIYALIDDKTWTIKGTSYSFINQAPATGGLGADPPYRYIALG